MQARAKNSSDCTGRLAIRSFTRARPGCFLRSASYPMSEIPTSCKPAVFTCTGIQRCCKEKSSAHFPQPCPQKYPTLKRGFTPDYFALLHTLSDYCSVRGGSSQRAELKLGYETCCRDASVNSVPLWKHIDIADAIRAAVAQESVASSASVQRHCESPKRQPDNVLNRRSDSCQCLWHFERQALGWIARAKDDPVPSRG